MEYADGALHRGKSALVEGLRLLAKALSIVEAENWKVSAYDGFTERNPRYRLDLLWIWCAAFAIGCQQGLDDPRVLYLCMSSRIFYYQNRSVVQKARKEFSFSHVKAKQDQECGGKYAEIPRDQHLVFLTSKQSKACFSHVKANQGQDKL